MSQPQHPHDCHPDLTEERLLAMAHFFASTRSSVVALHEPLAGDDAWSLGCRGFARWRNQLLQKAATREWHWLRILNPGKKFIFAIGSVPVRFYRGSPHTPPSRTLVNSAEELQQLSLAFATTTELYRDLKWRFAIETDFLGQPSAVIFAGLASDNGAVVCHWKLPFSIDVGLIELNVLPNEDMVELPEPIVGTRIPQKHNYAANDG